ncbi:MAG: nicotinate-nucleotide adenylyltransferase [Dehalococcoidia bacterium]|nr:nicotinate-nucleotide adenylyltransferase [Dehalococcoidia bacterium]
MVTPSGNGEKTKVGVLGGTFDPVHNGHLAIAEETRCRLELDDVIFVPAGKPWMKAAKPITPAAHRIAMVRLAISRKPCYRLSTIEVDMAGPSYTVDTLETLHYEYRGRAEFYFIMGWDNLPELVRWKNPPRIIELACLVALPRPGSSLPDLAAIEEKIPGLLKRVIIVEMPLVNISATDIRERVREGLPIGEMVPKEVEWYIREKGLYRD